MARSENLNDVHNRVELGYLSRDISFMSRVLRAHIRDCHAKVLRQNKTLSSRVATLSVISLNPGISQNDLAATLMLKNSAVTQLITDMEARGLVIRERSKSDRRFNTLRLSPEGEAQVNKIRSEVQSTQEELLSPLDHEERKVLFQLLGRLLSYYPSQNDESTATDIHIASSEKASA